MDADKDWKEYDDLDKRELTIMSRWFWFTVIAVVATFLYSAGCSVAHAAPIFRADEGGTSIVLTDEPCKLDAVKNLPYRATWSEKGQKYEGCWGEGNGIVIAYFDDKTVAIMPQFIFKPITGV